jgi:nitrogen fixation/metabolism regulation signal transduction histidine kinase
MFAPACAGGAAIIFARRIVRPAEAFERATLSLGAGDLATRARHPMACP